MENFEPRLYDVKISHLQKLDGLVGNDARLDAALGSKLDAQGSEHRLINAARALFGKEFDDTIDLMITEGQPGYLYKEARLRMLTAMRKPPASTPRIPRMDDADAFTGGTAEQARQQP